MKITKFVHSCLLVESPGHNVLIDPGIFTWSSRMLHINNLPRLDHIVITHEHADHYDEQGLKKLSHRFPHTTIITNDNLAEKIKALRLPRLPNPVHAGSDDNLIVFEAVHEPLPLDTPQVPNIGVHIDDKLTHPGDSYAFEHTREILALPLTGPFASYKQALDIIVKLKPKIVVPLHDWEWHRAARENRYTRAKELLKNHKIDFIELENAEQVEL
jgi:L-ascorbate metabolism protein UlaG (beta-lactamase superfamily)